MSKNHIRNLASETVNMTTKKMDFIESKLIQNEIKNYNMWEELPQFTSNTMEDSVSSLKTICIEFHIMPLYIHPNIQLAVHS